MFSVRVRCAVVSLLLLAGSLLCAQTLQTPAARRQQADRAFLLRRGIGLAASSESPVRSLQAARQRQAVIAASAAPASTAANTTIWTGAWQPSGPLQLSTPAYGLVTGRVSSLAADPNDTTGNTVYLGATGGGVWKSTNAAGNAGSVSFTPLTDDISVFANSFTSIPSLSIGALTVQPGNPNLLLAGTGDPNDALDSYYGVGILRSTNGGSSWSLIQQSSDAALNGSTNYSMQGVGFAGFAWSTATPNLVVAAASQSLEGLLVNTGNAATAETGLYYSSDAGQTWHLATVEDGPAQIFQSSDPPTSPPGNPATAVVWNAKRNLFVAAIRFHGYYSSSDGITWTRLASQPGPALSTQQCPSNPGRIGSPSCPIFRGALAVQPSTGDIFALTTDINNVDQGLYQDVCSTSGAAVSSCASSTIAFGTRITDSALDAPDGTIPQADYNLALSAVSSQQDTILFAGNEDIYRCSLANSCTWRNTTNDQTCAAAQVAPSTHAIDGTFGANGLVYFGNDGGLWRSSDIVSQTGPVCAATDAAHYQNLNSGLGSLAEITHLAVSPANASLVLAGMGGFGIISNSAGPWQQLLTGEGSYVAIDPLTPANWYADSGPGVSIFSCPNGGNCSTSGFGASPAVGRADVDADADYFLDAAPWMLDPLDPSNIILGTCRMWLGPVTGDWGSANLLSGMLDGNQGSFCDGNAQLRSVGAGGSYNSAQGGEQVYAGMAGLLDGGGSVPGHLFGATVPQGGGPVTWSDLWRNPVTNASLSSQFNQGGYAISAITVDPHDSTGKTIYVGIAGFPYNQSGMLYKSSNGGASWLNITNSLPQAPVSSIVVDPGNSGAVYVGGDFGAYYTTNVANCTPGQNCWSQLSSGLPNAPVTGLQMVTSGSSNVLEAATYGRGIWTLGLSTTQVAAQAALSPGSATFPSQAVGSKSSTVNTFTLSNPGSTALVITQVSVSPVTPSGDYAETTTCGSSLGAKASCKVSVTFTPAAVGDRPGTLKVATNAQSGTLTATLDGTGLAPGALTLSPGFLTFDTTATGASSAPKSVSVTNTGGAPVIFNSATITGTNTNDFSIGSGNACTGTLAANTSCTISLIFNPVQTGARTAILQLASSTQGSPSTVNLSGSAVSPATLTLTPSSLAFPGTPQNSTSPAQSITVANSGGVPAQLGTAATTGDYTLTANTCGSTLPANSTCTVSIAFAPTATGNRAGLFTLPSTSTPNDVPLTAPLSGTGLQPATIKLAPGSLSFNPQQQGTTSASMAVSVSNSSGSTITFGTRSITGDYAVSSTTCQSTLATGSNCSISVTFTPTAAGARSGALTVPYNGGSASVSLAGTGTAPGSLSFSPSGLAFPTTAQNASYSLTVTVTNTGSNPAQITGASAANPFAIATNTCPAAPQTLAVNATCTLGVTFTPPGTAAYSGALTFTGNFSNSPTSVPLSGQGAVPANATLTPSVLTFPDTAQGSTSTAQNITVTSTGGVPVTLGAASVTTGYTVSSCPASLAPGSTCTLAVLFHPTTTGPQPGTLTQPGNMPGGSLTANLNGTGLTPGAIMLSPGSLGFGSAAIGSTTSAQTVTVGNAGQTTVTLSSPGVSSGYTIAGSSCGASLDGGKTCTFDIAFKPTAVQSYPGQFTVPNSGASNPSVTLTGTGTTPGSLGFSPPSLEFGIVATGSSANVNTTVTNTGGTAVHLGGITATGDFAVTGGTCQGAATIAANASCSATVTFTPKATGSRTGTLTLANDGSPTNAQAALAGTGAAPANLTLAPLSLQFSSVVLNTSSAPQMVRATNSGGVPVQLSAAAITGGAGFSVANDSCGSSLAAGVSCTLQVVFTPSATGDSAATLSLPGQYSSSPASVALDGNGVTPGVLTFTPSNVLFGLVVVHSTATQSVSVQNTGGAPVTLGAPFTDQGSSFGVVNHCGTSLAPGSVCTMQVSFSPGASAAANGLLTVPASVTGSPATVPLSGNGVPPGALAATPATGDYPSTVTGSTSTPQSFTFRNTGGVAVALTAPVLSSTDYTLSSSTCGSSIAPNATCSVAVAFTPTASGDRPGTLTLAGAGANAPTAHVTLDGTGQLPAHLAFAPPSLAFGPQAQNTTSAPQTLTLTNDGGVPTTLGLPVLSGQYALAANSCGNSLAAGANCTIQLRFAPTSHGPQSGTLAIAGSTGTPSASAALSGTGLALVVAPAAYTFTPAVAVGSSLTAPTQISVSNLGSTPIPLTAPSITGDFAIVQSTCGSTLAGSSECSIVISFTPTGGGQRTGLFTISSGSESGSTVLDGTGLSQATDALSPGSLRFGPTVIGGNSAPQSVTLTNTGDATLSRITASVTGPFLAASNCGASLGGHLSCSIAVTYAPSALGTESGTLTVSDAQRMQTVALTGQGAAPPQAFATPSSINFGPYAVAVSTAVQTVTVSNQGSTPMTGITVLTSSADFAVASSNCGQNLAPGASCQLGVTFTPGIVGNRQATLTVDSPSLASPLVVSLAGSGEDYALSVVGNANDVITEGQTATYQLAVTPVGASSGSLAISCSGAPANSVCTANPSTLTLSGGAPGSITLSIATGAAVTTARNGSHPNASPSIRLWQATAGLAFLCPLLFLRRDQRRRLLLGCAALTLLCSPIACGVHASGVNGSGTTAPGQTPSGSYTLTVTAAFPGAQRTTAVTLVVQ